ncbi:MAG: formate dehydrogenase accessory sulfurtransferase FdhD [Deltaproteobacteria bacterium]|nr:formate dehydrogenase accessory sulfurtransferase FdhD [Deltaproteobacteria bacterium]
MKTILRYDGRRLTPIEHHPVEEFPLVLSVNGTELATLIASPHDLQYLVTGFLRLQGLVRTIDDFLSLSVCPDSGRADVRIKGSVPVRLKPVLTSGCGTGVTFDLDADGMGTEGAPGGAGPPISPDDVFFLMESLAHLAEKYRRGGGIHSAAVGEERSVVLHAEDIGRHNTIDRIAGEALLRQIDLSGKLLVTSGRVSSEMAAKAATLGIAAIASRTSPTDMAVRICGDRGIVLIGYARGGRFNVYAHPERLLLPPREAKIAGITGVILAGGSSSRMGSNKALLPHQGGRFIEAIHRRMAELFDEVLVVTNAPTLYEFLPCRKAPDLIPGMGALSGIHSGLVHSRTPRIFVAACDMPHLKPELIRHLAEEIGEHDVVVPESEKGLEPLHAIYGRTALPAIEEALHAGRGRIVSFFDRIRVKKVMRGEVALFDPTFSSFRNINTPEDYFRLREELKGGTARDSREAQTNDGRPEQ